jgi:hypothetical protein
MPVLGPEDLVDLGAEELGDDPRLVGERGLDLARHLLELVADELGVDRALLALQHPRADLDRVHHDARRVVTGLDAPVQERRGRGIVDDDVVDDHAPHQDVDAGNSERRGGFHGG